MRIRRAEAGDAQAIAALERECFSDAWSGKLIGDDLGCDNKYYFVAEEDGAITGYVSVYAVLDEGQIMRICVTSAKRRNGTGEKLLRSVIESLRTLVSSFTLEVREGNTAARNLYEKCGFVFEGVRPSYYDNGEGAGIYRLNI
ncbi:MAG: ribosomal protein S18-alanine N-acetyltransferase [Christensenellales bacterium]